eukprot:GEMP01017707.1.p1 GENE.GEMP01017707.1~~GEMP01017707.1.p1  ORF type:complete len:474 (+),score=112.97 GEMP01017707.1:366-1787(+)
MESSSSTTALGRNTDEWGWIEHLLRVSCRSSSLHLRNVWRLSIPKQEMNFERRAHGLLTLFSWVPISKLTEDNPVQQVVQRGFTIPPGGITFHVGNVTLPGVYLDFDDPTSLFGLKRRAKNAAAGRRRYEFLLCRVCVGKSYLVEEPEKAHTADLPPEYDTLYIYRDAHPSVSDAPIDLHDRGILPQNVFHHEYVIRDSSLVHPMFLVHFEFNADDDELLALQVCESCEQHPATIWCPADEASFCETCDETVHSANILSRRHIRVAINEGGSRSSNCHAHTDSPLESYCMACRMPLCAVCRTKGNHSAGEAARHHVVPLQEAYRVALQASRKQDPAVGKVKEGLHYQLRAVEELLKEVELNGTTASERVHALVQEALAKGQSMCEKKIHQLLSQELNCRRQLDFHDWMEKFLKKQENELNPADFLHNWVRHCTVRRAMTHIPDDDPPMPNLRLEGGVKVSTCPVETNEMSKHV